MKRTGKTKNCSNCEHAKYDDIWGEYKCTEYHHRCSKAELDEGCPSWKEKKAQD